MNAWLARWWPGLLVIAFPGSAIALAATAGLPWELIPTGVLLTGWGGYEAVRWAGKRRHREEGP